MGDGGPASRQILFRAFAIPQPGPCPAQDPVPCQDSSATYTVFDLLYDRFESLQTLPLRARRQRLKTVVRASANSRLVFSEGIVGRRDKVYSRNALF